MSATGLPQPAFPDLAVLLTGTLAHLSNPIHAGGARSVHCARLLLLHRMDHRPAFDRALLDSRRTFELEIIKAWAAAQQA